MFNVIVLYELTSRINFVRLCCLFLAMQVLLRDPTDDDVVPIVEELRRRLPKVSASGEGQGEEEACVQDGEGGEENGVLCEIF